MDTNVTKLEVWQASENDWHWHGKAANGEIVTQGEGHTTKADAIRAAKDVFPGLIPAERKSDDGGS